MKVLFIERRLRVEPLGIMYLSAVLKKAGYEADLIQTELEDIDKEMREWKPDFVAFSITTGEQNWAFEVNRSLKEKYHNISNFADFFNFKSVFGGAHCFSRLQEQVRKNYCVLLLLFLVRLQVIK